MPVLTLADLRARLNAAKAAAPSKPKAKADPFAPESWHAEANAAVINVQPCECGQTQEWAMGWYTLWRHRTVTTLKLVAGRTPGLPHVRYIQAHQPTQFCPKCLSSKLSESISYSSALPTEHSQLGGLNTSAGETLPITKQTSSL